MSVLVVLFFVAMAVATFVENDYGTPTAKALIYNARWFELIMLLLALNFIGNISRYKLFRREKWPVLLFHIAFLVILVGAFVTRYFGFEGLMPIREGETTHTILSDITYISAQVDNGKEQKDYQKEVLFGALSNNHFKWKEHFREKPFTIEYQDFVPNAKNEFVQQDNGTEHLHLVVSDANGRKDVYIADKEIIPVGNQFIGFNKPMQGVFNLVKTELGLFLQPPVEGNFMTMQTQELTPIPKDSVLPAQLLKLYTFENLRFVLPEMPVKGEKKVVSATKEEKNAYPYDALFVKVTSGNDSQEVVLQGGKNMITDPKPISVNGLNMKLNYGSKALPVPFGIKLRDFQLERYPGTNSASSYASEVTVVDTDQTFDYRIYMNHVLDYKGFRFFQSSYDPDELGTVLSVNHDRWGTLITYIGYFLMSIAMFFTLIWKGTRFTNLAQKLTKLKSATGFVLLFLSIQNFAQTHDSVIPPSSKTVVPEVEHQKMIVSKDHAQKFGSLLIQDHQGRIKPVNTYALEALRKVYKKDNYNGLTAEQVLLSAQIDPYTWGEEYIIHVKPNALGKKVAAELQVQNTLTSAANFYKTGHYYLSDLVGQADIKKNMDRTATDKEIINLDERFNVWLQILNGSLLHIYPKPNDLNNKWYAGNDTENFVGQDTMFVKLHHMYLSSLVDAVKTGKYENADFWLDNIAQMQQKVGAAVVPSPAKTNLEIQYNRWNIFKYLMMGYMTVGFVLLVLAFGGLFGAPGKVWKWLTGVFTLVTLLGVTFHAVGLAIRWYISGHAPWSNGYEAVVFVAFVTVIAGLLFSYKKSTFIIAVAVIMASLLMGIAHGSTMNPEITNLVPVLKSYWLMIHVAVITSSYGFLGLGAILGLIVLLLFILQNPTNQEKTDKIIDELTYVNEMTLTVGLFTLSIGTFLGGVWANESWGRYWSWDPKEVWSLISMMVYVLVLHMRLIPGLRGKFAFNLASLWSIATLIMTFFGVNFYLSGMHSYAAGDPVPIPTWVYVALGFFLVFSVVSYWRYRKIAK